MPALYSHTTRANGTVLTATIYNGDHQNHIDNGVPAQLDDYSVNAGQMQSQVSPGGVGSESLPTSLAGELERLRYVLALMRNTTYWYGGGSVPAHYPIDVQTFTSSGTWTKPAGCTAVFVRVVGGGGAGGGAPATGVGESSIGGGGGGGGYAEKWITSGLGATETVTIGAGGTGVSGATGNSGGNSSFGAHATGGGGGGGNANGPASSPIEAGGGSNGGGTGGTYSTAGNCGHMGFANAPSGNRRGGAGGASGMGSGGANGVGGDVNGAAAQANSGGGGGGASNGASLGAKTGGAGGSGVVIVHSFT